MTCPHCHQETRKENPRARILRCALEACAEVWDETPETLLKRTRFGSRANGRRAVCWILKQRGWTNLEIGMAMGRSALDTWP